MNRLDKVLKRIMFDKRMSKFKKKTVEKTRNYYSEEELNLFFSKYSE